MSQKTDVRLFRSYDSNGFSTYRKDGYILFLFSSDVALQDTGIIVLKLLDAVAFDQVDAVRGEETNGTNHRDDRIVRIDMLHRLVKVMDAFRHVWRI